MYKSIFLGAALALAACTTAEVQTTLTDAQQAACQAQTAANATTAILLLSGDAAGAAASSQASTLTGALCTWQSAPAAAPAAN